MKTGIVVVLVMGLAGFNEIYWQLQGININWMLVSVFLMFGIAAYVLIKVYAK